MSGWVLVQAAVASALSWAWRLGDQSRVAATIAWNKDAIAHFQERLASASDSDEVQALKGCIVTATEAMEKAHERQRQGHEYYLYLCETLVPSLAMEELIREPVLPENPIRGESRAGLG